MASSIFYENYSNLCQNYIVMGKITVNFCILYQRNKYENKITITHYDNLILRCSASVNQNKEPLTINHWHYLE
jgi:hypothetical protein